MVLSSVFVSPAIPAWLIFVHISERPSFWRQKTAIGRYRIEDFWLIRVSPGTPAADEPASICSCVYRSSFALLCGGGFGDCHRLEGGVKCSLAPWLLSQRGW